MDKKRSKALVSKIKTFECSPLESFELAQHLLSKIKDVKGFSRTELDVVEFLIRNLPSLLKRTVELENYENKVQRAEKILRDTLRPVAKRKQEALNVFGLNIKLLDRADYRKMKTQYENLLLAEPDSESDGVSALNYWYNSHKIKIVWTTDRERRMSTVAAIAQAHGMKSVPSVIAQLRKLRTKSLPAYENSGRRHSSHRM